MIANVFTETFFEWLIKYFTHSLNCSDCDCFNDIDFSVKLHEKVLLIDCKEYEMIDDNH